MFFILDFTRDGIHDDDINDERTTTICYGFTKSRRKQVLCLFVIPVLPPVIGTRYVAIQIGWTQLLGAVPPFWGSQISLVSFGWLYELWMIDASLYFVSFLYRPKDSLELLGLPMSWLLNIDFLVCLLCI